MYNEVFKNCPECGYQCEIQISQVVTGFGGFNLNDTDSLALRLNEEQLHELHEKVKDSTFHCPCDHSFNAITSENRTDHKKQLAKELFG